MYDDGMRCLAAWMLLLFAPFACADDAAWTYVGSAGNFSHNAQIRMVSERVDIKLLDEVSHFHATFVFCNEGPATTVTMAFPEERRAFDKKAGAIHNFFSSVDGIGVKVHHVRFPVDASSGSEYQGAWVKRVRFGRDQTQRVLVDYDALNGDRGDFVSNTYILETGRPGRGRSQTRSSISIGRVFTVLASRRST